MNKRVWMIFVVLLFGNLLFLSAKVGYNLEEGVNIDTSTSVINISNITNYINGSNINASSFSSQCSGTDKVINVTYSNFSGLFTVVCALDETTTGGEPLWSANYTLFNSTWSSTFNTTYNTFAYNQTIPAINQILSWAYYNSSSFNINDYYLKNNPFSFYNLTSWNNPYTYWNSTFATFNKTYGDTLYYSISNPSSFITLAQYFSNATTEFYPKTSNPFGYLNTSSETNWNANYSQVLNLLNNGYAYVNTTTATNLNNRLTLDWANITNKIPTDFNYKILSYWTNITDNPDFLSNFTDDVFGNSTLARTGNCPAGQVVMNTTTNGVQCVTLTTTELDPFWSSNFTLYNSSWSSINNATYNEAWLLTTNGTFYKRITNEYNYSNFTKLSQFTNDLSFYVDNIHSYFNSTNFPNYANIYLNRTNQFSYFNATTFSNYANVYLNTTNQFSYYNATSLQAYLNTSNQFGYYNVTTLSAYLNTSNQFGYINITTLAGNETDPKAYNTTLAYNVSLSGYREKNNNTFSGNVNISGNNITNVNYTTFCNGNNCWNMYVNASDWFIIEAV